MTGRSNDIGTISSRPMNIEQIVKRAQSFDYNPLIPLKYWLRTATTLLKEAEIYEHEGNDQQTYLLLYRHAQLVLRYLSTHPDARQPQNRLTLVQAKHDVENSLVKLEILKPRINKQHERYEQLLEYRDTRKAIAISQRDDPRQGSNDGRSPSNPAVGGATEAIAAEENGDLAVRLAHKEIRRRATARQGTRQAGISEGLEQERRTAGLWGNWEEALAKNDQSMDQDSLSRQMQNVRLQVNASASESQNGIAHQTFESQKSLFGYPAVPEHSVNKTRTPTALLSQLAPGGMFSPAKAPALPPKNDGMPRYTDELPRRPGKYDEEIPSRSATAGPAQKDLKPSVFTFQPSAYLENGSPLRTIFLPPDLRLQFLTLALPNTCANIETCGILCGTLISNALFVSKLVIPDQESTSDTCETINESELFDYVDGEDLMVLGWIHTHPTQTCFMSSRDLHTHCGYQVMMPESVAIVCAPSKGDWGVFRLTDPPGMKSVLNCSQTGLFHPHAESDIYTDALRPGHVYEAKGLEFDVVDLRPAR